MEHLFYLATLLRNAGHEVFGLSCGAAATACYGQILRGRGRVSECPRCVIGGLISYPLPSISIFTARLSERGLLSASELEQLTISSAATLARTEIASELSDPEIKDIQSRLSVGVHRAYTAARRWIDRHRLDAVIGFNGRIDMTAAVALAAKHAEIRYVSCERSWFGHGIQLIPDGNCLSLRESDRLTSAYKDVPLSMAQAKTAAAQLAKRFLRINDLEWRVYNRNARKGTWPGRGTGRKVLIIPSSKNEFQGHDEWEEGWGDNTKALDELIERMDLEPSNCVVRSHPNWAEKIGCVSGDRSQKHYQEWAAKRGVTLIPSDASVDTYDLLAEADLAVLNGGSTAFEAAALGKPVICLGPAKYREAGFSIHVNGPNEWNRLALLEDFDPELSTLRTLRFLYVQLRRFPQYVDYVRACSTTRYVYHDGADPDRLTGLITSGRIEPDDPSTCEHSYEERVVLDMLREKEWRALSEYDDWSPPGPRLERVRRRFGLRWLDSVRERLPRGDRG